MGARPKYADAELPFIQGNEFLKIPAAMYILQTELKASFKSFLKSMSSKEETISPKCHSTEMRTELIELLNASILAFV